jgi:hypothetical protein
MEMSRTSSDIECEDGNRDFKGIEVNAYLCDFSVPPQKERAQSYLSTEIKFESIIPRAEVVRWTADSLSIFVIA